MFQVSEGLVVRFDFYSRWGIAKSFWVTQLKHQHQVSDQVFKWIVEHQLWKKTIWKQLCVQRILIRSQKASNYMTLRYTAKVSQWISTEVSWYTNQKKHYKGPYPVTKSIVYLNYTFQLISQYQCVFHIFLNQTHWTYIQLMGVHPTPRGLKKMHNLIEIKKKDMMTGIFKYILSQVQNYGGLRVT